MSDQLTLDLEPGLPNLPVELRPMLARPAPAPFDSPEHLFEPNWSGERALAFIEPIGATGRTRPPDGSTHVLRLIDGHGRDLASLLPELGALPERVGARSAVLDGELVVVGASGRPDPHTLARRLAGEKGVPVAYLVFDLLVVDGRPLLGTPLERRREVLGRILVPGAEVVTVPAIVGDGLALHAAVVGQGIPGVMARHRRSPYLPGVRSRLWRFVSATDSAAPIEPGPEPDESGIGATAPVLALFRRLPLDEG